MKVQRDRKLKIVGGKARVGGMTLEIATEAEAEAAHMVVCPRRTRPLILEDNLTGYCFTCGCNIQFRPTSPKTPPKVCVQCAQEWAAATRH